MSTEHLDTGLTDEPVAGELSTGAAIGPAHGANVDDMIAAPSVPRTDPQGLPRYSHPHVQKFRLATALLFIVAVAAVAGAVVFLVEHNKKHGATAVAAAPLWSTWHPTHGGAEGTTEIADHVAPYYRLNASQQLDAVTPIAMSQSNNAGITTGKGLTVVVNAAGTSSTSQNLELLVGDTVAYNVCGLGPANCELPGTASTARMLLLRREALELALYTFKYQPNVQNVISVLPPGHTATASGTGTTPVTVSVLFVRAELKSLLNTPLDKTLGSYPLQVSELGLWSQTNEATLVNTVTAGGLFTSQVESQQEGGNLLVLNPINTQ